MKLGECEYGLLRCDFGSGHLPKLGQITQMSCGVCAIIPADTTLATQMALLHSEFCKLIKQRNDLLHANPATAPNGDQILIRQHFQAYIRWDFPTVRGATVAFDKANEIGGKIFEMLP